MYGRLRGPNCGRRDQWAGWRKRGEHSVGRTWGIIIIRIILSYGRLVLDVNKVAVWCFELVGMYSGQPVRLSKA